MSDFTSLGLSGDMLRALEHAKFTETTPIQRESIPLILANRDVIGVAQTGSGKTAAFVIPMLEKLATFSDRAEPHMPRALILAPTRELAIQTTDRIKELAVGMRSSCCTIYGGAPYRTQTHILRRGVDILVSTPGRLLDHIKRGNVFLDAVEYFVLDEADRMLDLGFVDDVKKISAKINRPHQSVMFSATLSDAIVDLKDTLLNEPAQVEVAASATVADNLDHFVLHVPGHQKRDLLQYLIENEEPTKSIVFVRTRRDAEEIATFLSDLGLKADALHGDKAQKLRQRTIAAYRRGDFDYLVATDVAARGIDVQDISHVFNFDVPVEAESYVHRIGRTARGGKSGRAFTLCGKNEPRLLKAIEAILGDEIMVIQDHPYRLIAKKKASIAAKKRPAVAAKKAKQLKGKRAQKYGDKPAAKGPKKAGGNKTSKNKGRPQRDDDRSRNTDRTSRSQEQKQRSRTSERSQRRDERPSRSAEGRPNRSQEGKPNRGTGDRPNRPAGDRPNRGSGDRPSRSGGGKPSRPAGSKPGGNRAGSGRPDGGKRGKSTGAKPGGRGRPGGNRPTGGKPWGGRPKRGGGNAPLKRR